MRASDTPDWYMARLHMLFDLIADVLDEMPAGRDTDMRRLCAHTLWSSVPGIVYNVFSGTDAADHHEVAWCQIDLLVTMFVRGLETDAP
jgi:hypothetical protein